MSIGLALPVILSQAEVFKTAAPDNKLTPRGYLNMLLHNNKPDVLSNTIDDRSGYIRDVKIRSRKRWTLGKSTTADDCSIQAKPQFYETTIPSTLFRKIGVFFEWSFMEKLYQDALQRVNLPNSTPTTGVIKEVVDTFQMAMNGLLGDINDDLLAAQAVNFGKNAVTGLATAKVLNFQQSTTTNPLTGGWVDLQADAMANEIDPSLAGAAIVGSGLINNFYLKQGFDPIKTPNTPPLYYDPRSATKWGANQFGLFAKDAVQFLNVCRFRGFMKSGRFGTSNFGVMRWPVRDSFGDTGLSDFEFDFQIRELDCPTDDMVIAGGAPQAVGRGIVVDVMASYGQVNIPSDAYDAADPLTGTNGTARYSVTNV